MKAGAEPRKIGFLVLLVGAAGYLLYSNVFSSPGSSVSASPKVSRRPAADTEPPPAITEAKPAAPSLARSSRRNTSEFRPTYKTEERVDPSTVDPKLRLDLLAKVQSVEVGAAERNLFQFGPAEVPKTDPIIPKVVPGKGGKTPNAEAAAPQPPPGPPPAPPPPPIPLKYYGYTAQRADGRKRAFFTEGNCTDPNATSCDIFVAAEGELVKRRYKVVRIGINSVELEDTQFNNNKQTLPLAPEETSG